jgi:hypothetical protein
MKHVFFMISALCICFSAPAQENFIKNGDFSDSNSNVWNLIPNSSTSTPKIELSRYIISIESPGKSESAPQLLQQGIPLTEGEGYTLRFKVSANDTGYIRALVAGDGNAIYSDTGLGKVKVTVNGTKYSMDFFVQKSTSNGKVLFNCGISRNLTKISFDSVSLTKNSEPIITITDPSSSTRWLTGKEQQISWKNSGTLDQVKIQFSSDSGATWTAIVAAATNQKTFWWNVPATAAGKNCLVIVSNVTGSIADTSAVFKTVLAGTIESKELVKNSDFSDTTDWKLSLLSPARATGKYIDNQYSLLIDTLGANPWDIKLEQGNIKLENGKMYRFAFDAYASRERTIFANIGGFDGNPTWSIAGWDTTPVKLTTTKTRYYRSMVMSYPTTATMRIEFNCSNDKGNVYFDNVSLIEMDSSGVYIFKPSSGMILKAGSKFNIEWMAATVTNIDLDFSSDSGAKWDSIVGNIDNLGAYSWLVPDKSSERCLVRIKNAANDSVLGVSTMFQINKFGMIVKSGELIANGAFTNKLQPWKTDITGTAQGQANIQNGMYGISITEPGSSLKSILLSQSGIPVLGGKEYNLAFEAFANGNRSMAISVFAENDTVPLFDSTFDLPSVKKELDFKFTPSNDALVRVEFEMGGSRASVFLDNVSMYTGPKPVAVADGFARAQISTGLTFGIRPIGKSISFSAGKGLSGSISIYNLKGSLIRNVPITESALWDGKNTQGASVSRGAYVAVLRSVGARSVRQFIVR